jgi:hypothetical protein
MKRKERIDREWIDSPPVTDFVLVLYTEIEKHCKNIDCNFLSEDGKKD